MLKRQHPTIYKSAPLPSQTLNLSSRFNIDSSLPIEQKKKRIVHQPPAMAALWFKTSLLLSLLILMPFSYVMVIDGFQDGMQTKYKLDKGGIFQMNSPRKLLMLNPNAMLDYDDAGANSKHDPIKKRPGKP